VKHPRLAAGEEVKFRVVTIQSRPFFLLHLLCGQAKMLSLRPPHGALI